MYFNLIKIILIKLFHVCYFYGLSVVPLLFLHSLFVYWFVKCSCILIITDILTIDFINYLVIIFELTYSEITQAGRNRRISYSIRARIGNQWSFAWSCMSTLAKDKTSGIAVYSYESALYVPFYNCSFS